MSSISHSSLSDDRELLSPSMSPAPEQYFVRKVEAYQKISAKSKSRKIKWANADIHRGDPRVFCFFLYFSRASKRMAVCDG
jgi:hypothetical protein